MEMKCRVWFQVAYLKQVGDSTYPDDVALLKLVATFESRTRLRVQIVDALHERFHVDVLGAPPPPPPASQRPVDVNDTDYQFVIDTGLTGFSVVRRASQEVRRLGNDQVRWCRNKTIEWFECFTLEMESAIERIELVIEFGV